MNRTSNNLVNEMYEELYDFKRRQESSLREAYFDGYRQCESLLLKKIEQLEVQMDLKEKIETNTWDHLDAFLKVYKQMKEGKWTWVKNMDCKYVELRVDMRDGGCILMNRRGKRIDPKDLEYQYRSDEK